MSTAVASAPDRRAAARGGETGPDGAPTRLGRDEVDAVSEDWWWRTAGGPGSGCCVAATSARAGAAHAACSRPITGGWFVQRA